MTANIWYPLAGQNVANGICMPDMRILFVVAAMAFTLSQISGCASIAAYQASHPYYKFPGSGAGGGNN